MTRLTASLLIIVLAATAWPAPRPKGADDEAFFCATVVGTKWVYLDPEGEYAEAITEAKPDGKATILTVVRTKDDKETWRSTLRVSSDGLTLIASGGITYEKPSPWLRSGLKPGEEWEYTYRRGDTEFHNRVKFVGFESVEVGAGKFQAMRLDVAETIDPRGGGGGGGRPNLGTDWWAPGIGLVKRVRTGQETTLKSFTRGK
jgi:hypothetical protein